MVCCLLIKEMFAYGASLFHRACPIWIAVICMVMIRPARVVGRSPVYNRQSLVKTWMSLCLGKQLVDPSAIPTTELLSL
jgi:hypothetical protein